MHAWKLISHWRFLARDGNGPTERAHGVIGEPSIGASPMERVPAFRQHPCALPHLDVVQTDRTLRVILHRPSVLQPRQPLQLCGRHSLLIARFSCRCGVREWWWLNAKVGAPEHEYVGSQDGGHPRAHRQHSQQCNPCHHLSGCMNDCCRIELGWLEIVALLNRSNFFEREEAEGREVAELSQRPREREGGWWLCWVIFWQRGRIRWGTQESDRVLWGRGSVA